MVSTHDTMFYSGIVATASTTAPIKVLVSLCILCSNVLNSNVLCTLSIYEPATFFFTSFLLSWNVLAAGTLQSSVLFA